MYFSEELRNRVVDDYYNLLNQDGFLALGLAEISNYYTNRFTRINYENTVLFQKRRLSAKPSSHELPHTSPFTAGEHSRQIEKKGIKNEIEKTGTPELKSHRIEPEKKATRQAALSGGLPSEEARYLFESGEYEKAVKILLSSLSIPSEAGQAGDKRVEAFEILIRALTSAGNIELAIDWCRKGIEENKLSARFYILLANLLNISGDISGVIEELKKAVYLEPQNFLANFYLANIFRKKNDMELSQRYLANALTILSTFGKDEVLQETEGITAGRMKEIVEKQIKTISNK